MVGLRRQTAGTRLTNEEGNQRSRPVGRELHAVSRPSSLLRPGIACLVLSFVLPSALVACTSGPEKNDSDLRSQSTQARDKLRAAAQELGRDAEATAGKPSK